MAYYISTHFLDYFKREMLYYSDVVLALTPKGIAKLDSADIGNYMKNIEISRN